MTTTQHKIKLAGITEREAIADALYRTVLAYDLNDEALLDSSMTKDITFEINGQVTEGLEAIKKGNFGHVATMNTGHLLGNLRIDHVPGSKHAHVTASAYANHFATGDGFKGDAKHFFASSLHEADVVHDAVEDVWKVSRWSLKVLWTMGDYSIMVPEK